MTPKVHLGVDTSLCGTGVSVSVDLTEITCKNCLALPFRRGELGSIFDLDERCWPALRTMWEAGAEEQAEFHRLMEHRYEAEQLNKDLAAGALTERYGPPTHTEYGWMPDWWVVDDGVQVAITHDAKIVVRILDDDDEYPNARHVLVNRATDDGFVEELARAAAELWIKESDHGGRRRRLVV